MFSVAELIARAAADPGPVAEAVPRWDAARGAQECIGLLDGGGSLADGWRFGILQTIDAYNSVARGSAWRKAGADVFGREPPLTGSLELDAAFAALAEYLAWRDGWEAPEWAMSDARVAPEPWFVCPSPAARELIRRETPPQFSSRNVYATEHGLDRA